MAEQQRVPNLEELDEQQAHRFLTEVFFTDLSPEAVYQANHPDDYVMEMPQSGEHIRGRENMRRFHEAYPNTPSIRLRRVFGQGRALGGGGGQRLRRRAGNRLRDDSRAQRREDMARQALLRRAFRGS